MGKQPNQRGSGIVAFLLVLVIIGIIGFTGWYVWHSKQATDSTVQQPDAAAQSTATDTKKAGTGMKDSSVVEMRKYSTSPAELQVAVLNYTKSAVPDCVIDGKIVDADKKAYDQDVQYAGSGSAITGIGCDGSSATLFVKRTAGQWEMVEKTQFGFSCDTLKANKVPAKLLTLQGGDAQCSDGSGLVAYKD